MPELSIDQKSLLATGLLAIACVQLLMIVVGRGDGGFSPGVVRPWAVGFHRFGGYWACSSSRWWPYSCVVFLGPKTGSLRVPAHSLLGASVIALLFGKITSARAAQAIISTPADLRRRAFCRRHRLLIHQRRLVLFRRE